ncbi:hypothetical protein PN498_03475 [Oscillatoria sp. CS-180]|uniref:hypothetical protein n=1 Tax=Oscillatoria sp. CS-180 TaxID=3021720 RepID=UPI00232B4C52|nr:hypothetical protein [Oscillatoria sp. CS-180]MDB9525035.1 hypothetical protein [Oscillatoria sp. CS-180]
MPRVANSVLEHSQERDSERYHRSRLTLQEAQEDIFSFLLSIVKEWEPEEVLIQFKQLFFEYGETVSSDVSSAIYTLLFSNDRKEFHNTLKRSCYILINNWEVARQYGPIRSLVRQFEDPSLFKYTVSPTLKRLREWMLDFIDSQDYEELKLFISRFQDDLQKGRWTTRYTSYLLVPQYINTDNPVEQREAARELSRKLKDRYKVELALYTAHSQNGYLTHQRKPKNPTVLGDGALRLVKAIVARKGQFSYKNLAHLFLEQVKDLNYSSFKKSLVQYLTYSVKQPDVVKTLRQHLSQKLDILYVEYDQDIVDYSLQLRTCNRVIDYLMTEDQRSPSSLFTLMLSQGSSILLAILLLKLVLISRNSHHYIEARIADLIRYYEQFPKNQCSWVINFLEVFQVTFAIHAENVEYNLVSPANKDTGEARYQPRVWTQEELEACRIFSRMILGKETEDDSSS